MGLENLIKRYWRTAQSLAGTLTLLGGIATASFLAYKEITGDEEVFQKLHNLIKDQDTFRSAKRENDILTLKNKYGKEVQIKIKETSSDFKGYKITHTDSWDFNGYKINLKGKEVRQANLSPDGKSIVLVSADYAIKGEDDFHQFKLVRVDSDGIERILASDSFIWIVKWNEDNSVRFADSFSEYDVKVYDAYPDKISLLTDAKKERLWNFLLYGGGTILALTAGILGSKMNTSKIKLQKPSSLSDYLVASPMAVGMLTGGVVSYICEQNLIERHIIEASPVALFTGLLSGMVGSQLTRFVHVHKTPMIKNNLKASWLLLKPFRTVESFGADMKAASEIIVYTPDSLRLLAISKSIEGKLSEALYLEEKISAIVNHSESSTSTLAAFLTIGRKVDKELSHSPFSKVNHIYYSSILGFEDEVSKTISEILSMEGREWDEAAFLAGVHALRMKNEFLSNKIWTDIVLKFNKNYDSFKIGSSRNEVVEFKGAGLIDDWIIIEKNCNKDVRKFDKTMLVYNEYMDKHDVAKPVIYLPVLNCAVYQRTQLELCSDIAEVVERMNEFHKRMSAAKLPDFIEKFNYRDAIDRYCFGRFPKELAEAKEKLKLLAYGVVDSIANSSAKVMFNHGDFTFNNVGKCIDPAGKSHICVIDWELASMAKDLDAARLITHPTFKGDFEAAVDLIGKKMDAKSLLQHVRYDSMRLIGGCMGRNDKETPKHYLARMEQASYALGDKDFASRWSDAVADWMA